MPQGSLTRSTTNKIGVVEALAFPLHPHYRPLTAKLSSKRNNRNTQMLNTPNGSTPPNDKSNEKSIDMDGLLAMGGMLGGFSQIIQQLGSLAEKGEQLKRASQSDSSDPAKKIAGSFGYSVKFGGESFGGSRSTESFRSEERRVGKECRSRWSPYH